MILVHRGVVSKSQREPEGWVPVHTANQNVEFMEYHLDLCYL